VGDSYKSTTKQVLHQLAVDPSRGLAPAEARYRHQKYGPNALKSAKKISPFRLFLSQFNDVLIIVLIIAASISLGLSFYEKQGDYTEPLLIFAIVIAIAIIGFFNEFKAEKTVEALKKLVGQSARVRRGGREVEVEAASLVPGDIVLLSEGQKVPADLKLVVENSLHINESSLTGESVSVSKNIAVVSGDKALGDQRNMAFSGTFVTSGKGEGVVVAIGHDSELGKIASLVNEIESEETPMQKKLDELGKRIGIIILAISAIVFISIFFFDNDALSLELSQRLILAFTSAVALAVAAIPEGLAFVVRISLALGARRMAGKNALVRRLSAVEALGSTDVICSDKTGTLTKGEMTVRMIYMSEAFYEVSGAGYETKGVFSNDGQQLEDLKRLQPILRLGVLNNNAHLETNKISGDPTEAALLVSAAKGGLGEQETVRHFPRLSELPFSSERKMMSTVHQAGAKYLITAKGAPDVLLDKCDRILINDRKLKLTAARKQAVLRANLKLTKQALRVLGFAYRETAKQPKSDKAVEEKLVFVGLQGMIDPPRDEVKQVMHRVTAEAGMRVLMITGDHIETAKAIATEIGIEGQAITGQELDKLSQVEFERKVEKIAVYARVNPEHKIRIVKALKAHGHQVAMTGDGVNDAPAIKAADIGVAMGITGTDASKEAADLILLDDQFITIIDAIEEGRGIFDNVRKFVNYLLSANIGEVLAVLSGVLWLNKLVLSAAQLLFINIATDGLPAVALGSDPAEKGIMRFKPHRFQSSIITKRIWYEMVAFGVLMTAAILLHYWWIIDYTDDGVRAVSVAFTAMVVYEMVRLINIRTEYKIRWFSNLWLSVAMAGSVVLQLMILYIPAIAKIFGVEPILLADWLVIGLMSVGLHVSMRLIDRLLDNHFKETRPQFNAAHYETID